MFSRNTPSSALCSLHWISSWRKEQQHLWWRWTWWIVEVWTFFSDVMVLSLSWTLVVGHFTFSCGSRPCDCLHLLPDVFTCVISASPVVCQLPFPSRVLSLVFLRVDYLCGFCLFVSLVIKFTCYLWICCWVVLGRQPKIQTLNFTSESQKHIQALLAYVWSEL